uniref:Uncharacterized protein n=1 Tax=Anguilla anguilla TaxID=7936 RepID=A0A0E9WFH1_ANGAN
MLFTAIKLRSLPKKTLFRSREYHCVNRLSSCTSAAIRLDLARQT